MERKGKRDFFSLFFPIVEQTLLVGEKNFNFFIEDLTSRNFNQERACTSAIVSACVSGCACECQYASVLVGWGYSSCIGLQFSWGERECERDQVNVLIRLDRVTIVSRSFSLFSKHICEKKISLVSLFLMETELSFRKLFCFGNESLKMLPKLIIST